MTRPDLHAPGSSPCPFNAPVTTCPRRSAASSAASLSSPRSLVCSGSTDWSSLTGPGGAGKTRLALVAAGELVEVFDDGVWLVELAPLTDPALVTQTVAGALEVREQPGRPLTRVLRDYLATRRLLLVLDNCEHLVDACAVLVENLLHACPDLHVLTTSRESLSIPGEIASPVPALDLAWEAARASSPTERRRSTRGSR